MTAASVRRKVSDFMTDLLAKEIAILSNPHILTSSGSKSTVTWAGGNHVASGMFTNFDEACWREYLDFVRNGVFSTVLFDGSLLQVTYYFHRESVVGHRLCFYPCPVIFDSEELSNEFFELSLETMAAVHFFDKSRSRSPLRFEYDPEAARSGHPATHLHVNWPSCRIPVKSPVDFSQFLQFVFQNFYPEIWREHQDGLFNIGRDSYDVTIQEEENREMHINWAG